jgi:starvation-inducible DNA-binding protein
MAENQIGLEQQDTKSLAERLNTLLANYQVFYMNVRGFHWNITGEKFFELHAKFEELYNDLVVKVDEVAERILTLEHTPLHTFSDYTALSTVKEAKGVSNGKDAMQRILEAFRTMIALQREIADEAGKAGDEGTSALMSDYIREQEKQVWMYSAFQK